MFFFNNSASFSTVGEKKITSIRNEY